MAKAKARSKAGLTKKKVTVRRGGKTFQQTRMVRVGDAISSAHKSLSTALSKPGARKKALIGAGAVAAVGTAAYLAHRAVKKSRAAKGKKGAQLQAARPSRSSAFAKQAWGIARVVAPIVGGAIGSTVGEVHGGRLAEHLASRATKSAGRGKGFGATALHGAAALLRSQGGSLAAMAGGALGASVGGAGVHHAHRLSHGY